MKFIANRPLFGDYGKLAPGQIIEAQEGTQLMHTMLQLERANRVSRWRAPVDRKAYTVYQNKSLQAPVETKAGKR